MRPNTAVFAGRGVLLRALARALGSEVEAREFLDEVLFDAEMDVVPETYAFDSFVREEVLPRLMPLVRLEQMHELVRRTIGDEPSLPPPPMTLRSGGRAGTPLAAALTPAASPRAAPAPRRRIVIVEQDAFRRVATSRELVRAGFDVEVVASPAELLAIEPFHAVVMALDDPGLRVARELALRGVGAGIVVYDDPAHRAAAESLVEFWPNDRVSIVPRDASPTALTARVRIVAR